MAPALYLLCTGALFTFKLSAAALVNVTFDDQLGSPVRTSRTSFNTISYSNLWTSESFSTCSQCKTEQPFIQAVNGTWSKSTYSKSDALDKPKTASFQFTGTAVYVNCLLPPANLTGPAGNLDVTFTVDNIVVGNFSQAVPNSTQPPTTIFKRESLPLTTHTLVIQNGRENGPFDQVMLFLDSIVYTTNDSLISPLNSNTGTNRPFVPVKDIRRRNGIIAGVLSAVAGIAIIFLAYWYCVRVKNKRSILPTVTPFNAHVPETASASALNRVQTVERDTSDRGSIISSAPPPSYHTRFSRI